MTPGPSLFLPEHPAEPLLRIGFRLLLWLMVLPALGQESMPGRPVVCYGLAVANTARHVSVSSSFRLQQATAHIDVTYSGFPAEAMAPFQQAIDTWSTLLTSSVPIHINAVWAALPGSALASTGATKIYRGFTGAVQPDIWYPVALAEKLTGRELNGAGQADMTVTINKNVNWYAGTDGNTPANRTDLESVVLHEVAHGLGFASAAESKDSTGSLRDDGYLLIYDLLLETGTGVRVSTYPDPSADLLTSLTGNTLYLHSPGAVPAGQTRFPKVYAPPFFNAGGSISHLDEAAYPIGDPNALMTPFVAPGESVHTTGAILLGVLADMGWSDSSRLVVGLLLFPNPAANLVTVQLPPPGAPVSLQLIDLTGRLIRVIDNVAVNGSGQLDVSGLAAGVYTVVVTTPAGQLHRKLVIAR